MIMGDVREDSKWIGKRVGGPGSPVEQSCHSSLSSTGRPSSDVAPIREIHTIARLKSFGFICKRVKTRSLIAVAEAHFEISIKVSCSLSKVARI